MHSLGLVVYVARDLRLFKLSRENEREREMGRARERRTKLIIDQADFQLKL